MDPHFPISKHFHSQAGEQGPERHELLRDERHHLPSPRRNEGLPVFVAIVALLTLLLVFHYVVRGSLQQSELRQKAVAVHAQAIWRCNNLQGREVSDSCLLRANVEARRVATLQFKDSP